MRKKGTLKEVLIHSKNHALPSLPVGLRIVAEEEEDWSSQLAMGELIKHVATGLEENVFRHQLPLKEALHIEWSWREEPNKGSSECTILAHVPTGTNPINIQNKKHLHWKALDAIFVMNNNVESVALAHNLLQKKGNEGGDRQSHKNMTSNAMASPQAARKKHFTPLDLERSQAPNAVTSNTTPLAQKYETDQSKDNIGKKILTHGSIGNSATLKPPSNE